MCSVSGKAFAAPKFMLSYIFIGRKFVWHLDFDVLFMQSTSFSDEIYAIQFADFHKFVKKHIYSFIRMKKANKLMSMHESIVIIDKWPD